MPPRPRSAAPRRGPGSPGGSPARPARRLPGLAGLPGLSVAAVAVLATAGAAACGPAAPEPFVVQDLRDVHEHLRDMDGWRAEPERAAAHAELLRNLKHTFRTERLFTSEPGRRVAFHRIDAAGAAELGFDLWVGPWPDPPSAGSGAGAPAAEVTVVAYLADGGARNFVHRVPLERAPRARTVPCVLSLDAPGAVESVALQVAVPGAEEGARLALVRPWVREPRAVQPPAEPPRQVVLVTLDTVRRDHLGAYGHPRARTPNLDALAADGVLFEEAFSVTNVTNPAHTSLFTSLHLKDHKVRDNFTSLDPAAPTMMERLAEEGFRTAAFVASFNFQSQRSDLGRRFQDFRACQEFHERRAEDVNADALPWFTEHQGRDFFAWVHYFDAHMPYDPPPPWDALFEPRGSRPIELPLRDPEDLRAQYGSERDLAEFEARYLGELAYLDAQLGALLDHLRALGVYERATIVVTADHGEALGENGIYCEHRGLHDPVTAVPLLWRPGGGAPPLAGRRVAGFATLLDVYPTLFDYLGLEIGHPVRGTSLRPRLEGRAGDAPERVYAEHVEGLAVSVRSEDGLGVLGLGDRRYFPRFATRAGAVEWFAEGAPEDDRADEEPERAGALREELRAFLEDALPFEPVPVDDARYRAMLERLGYADPEKQ